MGRLGALAGPSGDYLRHQYAKTLIRNAFWAPRESQARPKLKPTSDVGSKNHLGNVSMHLDVILASKSQSRSPLEAIRGARRG